MGIGRRLQRIWQHWVVTISLRQVVLATVMVYGFDALFVALNTDQFWSGPVDWTAHIGTAVLILNLFPLAWRRAILPTALLGSFLIDLDHIPQFLGADFLTEGTPRPYTHSLTTPIVVCLAGVLICLWHRRAGTLVIGFGVGVVLHLFRDLAEIPSAGVSLLWPATKHAYSYPHRLYLGLIGALILANLLRLTLDPSLRAASSRVPER